MPIRAVLFDLDNTLTHRSASISAYSQYLGNFFKAQLRTADTAKIQDIIQRIDCGGYPKKEQLTHPSIAASAAYALLQELDWRHAPDFELLTQFWFSHLGRHAVAMPGAEAVLQELQQRGFKLAVISNGGHGTRLKIIQGLGFSRYFDLIVSSELAGIAKPDAQIFRYASQALGIAPPKCLFVGDHPVNDIQGANSAGMQSVLLSGFHAAPEDLPCKARIQQLDQLGLYLD